MLDIGCTPLLRATIGDRATVYEPKLNPKGGDIEVMQALLAKGANPKVGPAVLTPFLVAAGVGAGSDAKIGGTGLALDSSAGGPVNLEAMELLLQHGANVNDQVTGTKTYSMRISRAPSTNEGRTALHIAAQAGKTDLVRYLLSKGASTEVKDAGGRKPIDLVGVAQGSSAPSAATAAEIRRLLEGAVSRE